MQLWMLDAFLVVVILGITYALTSEGLWGAGVVFFNLLFSILVALNFYETLAGVLARNASAMAGWADFICLSGLFLLTFTVLKFGTENMAPTLIRFPQILGQLGRLVFGLAGGVMTVAFLLLVLYTAPVPKKIMNVLDYRAKSPFGLALDRKLLGFFQWSTAYPFPTGIPADAPGDKDFGRTNVFDPNGRWVLDRQNARPFGDEIVPEAESAGGSSGGSSTEGGAEGANPAGGQANANPGADNSPRVPGGTAGAAAGLAPQG